MGGSIIVEVAFVSVFSHQADDAGVEDADEALCNMVGCADQAPHFRIWFSSLMLAVSTAPPEPPPIGKSAACEWEGDGDLSDDDADEESPVISWCGWSHWWSPGGGQRPHGRAAGHAVGSQPAAA